MAILPIGDDQRRYEAVEHHAADGRRRHVGRRALAQHLRIVLDQVRSRQQRHRRLQDLVHRKRRRDERDVDRQRDDRHADHEDQVGTKRQDRAVLDHGCSVLDLALDIAELHDGERDDDDHQHHRLRVRAAEVESLEAVGEDLVDEDLRGLAPARRRSRCR